METFVKDEKTYALTAALHNWSRNPRSINKEDYERLKKQIQELGEYKPLIVTPDGEVLGGNMRLKAYQELGKTDVWVSVIEPKDEAEKVKYALSDNDRAGSYVEQDLAELVGSLGEDIELALYKVDIGKPVTLADLLAQFGPETEEDEVPEVSKDPAISQLGEVYQLGRHRLMCGDATKREDVEKLMDGQKADMVFTDPPYGVDFQGAKYNPRAKEWDGIKNDKLQGDQLADFIQQSFANIVTVCNESTPVYVWSVPMQEGYSILKGLQNNNLHIQSQLIWIKNTIVLGQADYQWRHEVCWYGWTPGVNHYWKGSRSLSTVWEYSKDANQSYVHPNQKPVSLATNAIDNSSRLDGVILDIFGGSGSTLIACEQSNRQCFMMELDPSYCDVIRKRYANYINQGEKWQEITPIVTEN